MVFFFYIAGKLSGFSCPQDNDNRVREASHKALKVCAEKVKNALGPHLRSLIGCWAAGMCDPHGPAASSAQVAFSAAFPLGKQKDVFKFGFKAILMVGTCVVNCSG